MAPVASVRRRSVDGACGAAGVVPLGQRQRAAALHQQMQQRRELTFERFPASLEDGAPEADWPALLHVMVAADADPTRQGDAMSHHIFQAANKLRAVRTSILAAKDEIARASRPPALPTDLQGGTATQA